MKTSNGNDAVVDAETYLNPTPEQVSSRRDVLRFLGAFGAVVPTASLIGAIDAGLADARAQTAAGQAVPRLSVYTPNWPDMIELWRQLAKDWSALGIDLDVQQGTLDTFVSNIVAEHKLPHLGSMSWGGAPDNSIRIISSPRCSTLAARSRAVSISASIRMRSSTRRRTNSVRQWTWPSVRSSCVAHRS